MSIALIPKDKELEHILDRLTKYPIVKVKPKHAQALSRHKKIRYLSSMDNIWIKKGIVGIPPQVKIRKRDGRFFFEF